MLMTRVAFSLLLLVAAAIAPIMSSPFLISVASPLYSCVRNKVSRTEQSLVRQQSYTIVAAPTPATDIDDGDCDDGIRIGTP